jgi:hypothetical protein
MRTARITTLAVIGIGVLAAAALAAEIPPPAVQIAAAVQAAPEDRRDGAEVLGYDTAGALTVLRKGSNELICLADKPGDEKWSVACYHRSLEPYMKRGRELPAQGVKGEERKKRRWKEAEEGKLQMPEKPAALYVLDGDGFDAATGKVKNGSLRYVVYTPYATAESTGLPLNPQSEGGPWLMFPGTPGAHIMISPPAPAAPAPPAPPTPPTPPTPPPPRQPGRS